MLDQTAPRGGHYYDRMHYLPEVGDGFIDAAIAAYEHVPTPYTHINIGWMGGAVDRTAPGDTAFGHRGAGALAWFIGASGDEPIDPVRAWVREVFDATSRHATGGAYVNALESGRPVRDAYADAVWERLVEIKRRYDPAGAFSGNGIGQSH